MGNRRLEPVAERHWLPRQGEPVSDIDWLTQQFVRTLAWWPIYTAVIVTLILVVQIGHPWGLGR